MIAGIAGLVAGSMSMAVGEYVSVSAQRDSQQADIEIEKRELAGAPEAELNELAMIYMRRGLEKELAIKVAQQLSARDRLASHLRDELGIEPRSVAHPLQAAWISAFSFATFAAVPIQLCSSRRDPRASPPLRYCLSPVSLPLVHLVPISVAHRSAVQRYV